MKRMLLAAAAVMLVGGLHAEERVDLSMTGKIRQEAFNHSQVMALLGHLTEDIGPRLTNSPAMVQANAWTRSKFNEWGLANVHDEAITEAVRPRLGIPFGQRRDAEPARVPAACAAEGVDAGHERAGGRRSDRRQARIEGRPGEVQGQAERQDRLHRRSARIQAGREAGLEPRDRRQRSIDMQSLAVPADPKPGAREESRERRRKRIEFAPLLNQFLIEEGAVASVSPSGWDNGIILVSGGGSRKAGESVGVPALAMSAEHYNNVMRALDRKEAVRLRVDVDAHFTSDTDQPAYNTIAEIPGTGPHRNEVVMIGAHMDSWHAGTGAADNGAGVAVMMEAMRILKAIGAKPDRTIRVALWTGEEQGLLGSADYVSRHFGKFADPVDPKEKDLPPFLRTNRGALQPGRDYGKVAAYFNLDNGGGKIRGVYAQENMEVAPIFEDVAQALQRRRREHRHPAQHRQHRPRVVRRHRPARLPVRAGRPGLLHQRPPQRPRRARPHRAGGPEAGLRDRGVVRVQRGDAAGEAAAEGRAGRIGRHAAAARLSVWRAAAARSSRAPPCSTGPAAAGPGPAGNR
jgi:carboxypeptidase Q